MSGGEKKQLELTSNVKAQGGTDSIAALAAAPFVALVARPARLKPPQRTGPD